MPSFDEEFSVQLHSIFKDLRREWVAQKEGRTYGTLAEHDGGGLTHQRVSCASYVMRGVVDLNNGQSDKKLVGESIPLRLWWAPVVGLVSHVTLPGCRGSETSRLPVLLGVGFSACLRRVPLCFQVSWGLTTPGLLEWLHCSPSFLYI